MILVWYCVACRHAARVRPKVFAPTCKCSTPVLPIVPTKVWRQ